MKRAIVGAVLALVTVAGGQAQNAWAADTEERIQQLERELQRLKEQVEREERPPGPRAVEEPAAPPEGERPYSALDVLDRVRLGGYGSVRFESNSLDELRDTFTFRRFVLTTDAQIADPLRFLLELELERFTVLELEREIGPSAGGLAVEEAIEGSNETEIALEQAWLQYELAPWARFRAGMLLVPLGRFNLNHDDNRWNIPRRPLVDRGVPVLPATSAWSEVGMGFAGDIPAGALGGFSYEAYVMNGVVLDAEVEKVIQSRFPERDEVEFEVELRPSRGLASVDLKNAKVGAGRLAWRPAPGYELGVSAYGGRYTPDFLDAENIFAAGVDGLLTFGPFVIEAEYLFTDFGDTRKVAGSFARRVRDQEAETSAAEAAELETKIEFELANLAASKHGYWIELRYHLFPDWLKRSVLGRRLSNPQLIPTLRWEQAWLHDLVEEASFSDGALTAFETDDRWVNRLTAGLAFRPVPLVVFSAAWEYTWTNEGKSLSNVTNFLPAQEDEDEAHAFLFGVAFGF